jgi:hypothetical protein
MTVPPTVIPPLVVERGVGAFVSVLRRRYPGAAFVVKQAVATIETTSDKLADPRERTTT